MTAKVELTPIDNYFVAPAIAATLYLSANEPGKVDNPKFGYTVGAILATLVTPLVMAISAVAFPIIAITHFICYLGDWSPSLTERILVQTVMGMLPLGSLALVKMYPSERGL